MDLVTDYKNYVILNGIIQSVWFMVWYYDRKKEQNGNNK